MTSRGLAIVHYRWKGYNQVNLIKGLIAPIYHTQLDEVDDMIRIVLPLLALLFEVAIPCLPITNINDLEPEYTTYLSGLASYYMFIPVVIVVLTLISLILIVLKHGFKKIKSPLHQAYSALAAAILNFGMVAFFNLFSTQLITKSFMNLIISILLLLHFVLEVSGVYSKHHLKK